MSKSIKEWLAEGEQLHAAALQEYESIEARIVDLEHQLEAKREEINELAQVIGKKPLEANPQRAVQIIEKGNHDPVGTSRITIARALTGR